MDSNVVLMSESSSRNDEKIEAFNTLYTAYLNARAAMSSLSSDEDALKACADWGKAIWAMAQAPAVLPYQVDRKLEALRELLEDCDVWADRREHLMLESIRCDVMAM